MNLEAFNATSCPDGYEPVFERVWKGVQEGAFVKYDYKDPYRNTYKEGTRDQLITKEQLDNFDLGTNL